jgi:hypothetical protein
MAAIADDIASLDTAQGCSSELVSAMCGEVLNHGRMAGIFVCILDMTCCKRLISRRR